MPVANLPAIRPCRPAWNKGRISDRGAALPPPGRVDRAGAERLRRAFDGALKSMIYLIQACSPQNYLKLPSDFELGVRRTATIGQQRLEADHRIAKQLFNFAAR